MLKLKSFIAILLVSLLSLQLSQSLTVHLVCHTHDDVGWLKTVDQYYIGLNQSIYQANVQFIIDSVIDTLADDANRTFVYVEQAFFQRWWREQTETRREKARQVVLNGQLEFINGGWCMHDEAASYYVDMIDQTTLGHKFLLEQFGSIPTIGWQIDPFGHSATQAALLSGEVGFDGLFFGRIDYQDHDIRIREKKLEFVWRASASLGEPAQVFSGAFQSGNYGPPNDMCFDIQCGQDAVNDNPELEDNNVQQYVEVFVQDALQQAQGTAGDLDTMNIMWTLGSDFLHENANFWFRSLDRLIKAVNADGRVKAMYSTPSKYVKAKNAEPVQWTVKTDDFFPYADGSDSYWTGYFTSRPALKRYIRDMSAYLQVARHFEVYAGANGNNTELLWEGLGVAQHHDAVSGTSKQHVAYDYARGISRGVQATDAFVNFALAQLVNSAGKGADPLFASCVNTNQSICPTSQNSKTFATAIYNPQARQRTEVVIVPVSSSSVTVVNATGAPVVYQNLVLADNQGRNASSAKYAVAFEAQVDGLGLNTYFIENNTPDHTMAAMSVESPQGAIVIANEYISIAFDINSGYITNVTDKQTGTTYPFTQDFAYYQGWQDGGQNSGAYIFRPSSATEVPIVIDNNGVVATSLLSSGPLVQEVQQVFSKWVSQIVRLRSGARHIEFEWTVGSVDISDYQGKEVIARYSTQIKSNSTFYTDSNGREMQTRIRNYRPTWKWDPTQPVAGNYYPVNSIVTLNDADTALVVNVDRAEGCSSLNDGQLECMVHRRLLVDDGRGVNEPLNETMGGILNDGTRLGPGLIITGHHYVHVVPADTAFDVGRVLQDEVYQPLHNFYAEIDSVDNYIKTYTTEFSSVETDLPVNVEVMTLMAWNTSNSVLLRLSHQFGVNEGSVYNKPVTVDISTLFNTPLESLTELSLTANQYAGQHKPYIWNTTDTVTNMGVYERVPLVGTTITINPMEIRTFNAVFQP